MMKVINLQTGKELFVKNVYAARLIEQGKAVLPKGAKGPKAEKPAEQAKPEADAPDKKAVDVKAEKGKK